VCGIVHVHHIWALGARVVAYIFGRFANSKRGKNKHLWPECCWGEQLTIFWDNNHEWRL